MKRRYIRFLIVAACIALQILGLARDNAQAETVTASPARDGLFFQGHGGALHGPFSLLGGRYHIDMWANYNSIYDAGNSGMCIFTAYLNGIEHPLFVGLGTAVPVESLVPWHYTPTLDVPAGHYKLIVSPLSDCDWSMTILRLGPAVPAIEVLAVRAYSVRGANFTQTATVKFGETIDFSAFYRLDGVPSGTPAGKIAIVEKGKHAPPPQTFRLYAAKDANGIKQFYIRMIFSQKTHDSPGPALATFTITDGTLHVTQSLDFTLTN